VTNANKFNAWAQMLRRTTCRVTICVVGRIRLLSNPPLRRDVAPSQKINLHTHIHTYISIKNIYILNKEHT
jgi:hypothetical protein